MGGDDGLDLYGRGGAPDRSSVVRGLVRVLGALVGVAISLYGAALYTLRCFDTCPSDPSVDASFQLLTAAVILFGLVVALASVSLGARWVRGATGVIAALGALIAVAGAVSLALTPSIDQPHGDRGSTALAAVIALLVGAAVAAAALFRRRSAARGRD